MVSELWVGSLAPPNQRLLAPYIKSTGPIPIEIADQHYVVLPGAANDGEELAINGIAEIK